MAFFQAFYDAAGSESSGGLIVVAGLVATEAKWRRFEREWEAVLTECGVAYFHMKDFNGSHRAFDGWAGDEPRRAVFLKRLIAVIKKNVNKEFIYAVRREDFDAVNEEFQLRETYQGGAYRMALLTCRIQIHAWLRAKYPNNDGFLQVVEKGDAGQGDVKPLIGEGGLTVQPKQDRLTGRRIRPFEAADLLGWEFRRVFEETETEEVNRDPRPSLREIHAKLPYTGHIIPLDALRKSCHDLPNFFPPRT
jgi:hypothetical protein